MFFVETKLFSYHTWRIKRFIPVEQLHMTDSVEQCFVLFLGNGGVNKLIKTGIKRHTEIVCF